MHVISLGVCVFMCVFASVAAAILHLLESC